MVLVIALVLLLRAEAIADCLMDASLKYGISPLLLQAIMEVESGGNPYAINVQVKRGDSSVKEFLDRMGVKYLLSYGRYQMFSIFPSSREQAVEILSYISSNNQVKTFDVGLMQVNRYWIIRYNLKPEWLLDDCYNLEWGAFILADLISRYGYSWEAVWRYNGRRSYAWKVFRKLRDITGGKR